MNSQDLYQKAYHLHYDARKYSEALSLYKQIVEEYPDSHEASYAKSQIDNINKLPESLRDSSSSDVGAENSGKTCPKCGEQIRDSNATFCPKCGVNVHVPQAVFSSPNNKTVQNSSGGLLKVLLVLVGLALVACLLIQLRSCSSGTSRSPATARPDRGSESLAYVMCKDFVKDNLVAPSTAEFAKYTEVTVVKLEDRAGEVYRVVGYVDSQNKFGAMIRVDYVCEIAYVGNDNWKLEKLDMEE